jgi:hypothetical protein
MKGLQRTFKPLKAKKDLILNILKKDSQRPLFMANWPGREIA